MNTTPEYKIVEAAEVRKQVNAWVAKGHKIEVVPLVFLDPPLRCPAGAIEARVQKYGNRNTIR